MGYKSEIEHGAYRKALKPPDYKTTWYRKDAFVATLYQTHGGKKVHLITYNSTGSYLRAKKWLKLKKRKILFDMLKSWGLITTIKHIFD